MTARRTVTILDVEVDVITKAETLALLHDRLQAGQATQVVTVTNEMIMRTRRHAAHRQLINQAQLRLPDTAGVVWAAHYQSLPRHGYPVALRTLLQLLIRPKEVRTVIPETVPGSDLSVDLAALAEEHDYRLFLLGAAPGVAEAAASELQRRFPKLVLAGAEMGSPKPSDDTTVRRRIDDAAADIILVAYGAPKQEEWIARNLTKLECPAVAVGVGGTLDYLAGTAAVEGGRSARQPPAFIRRRGLEWLWRLATQPSRWRRIITALPLFVRAVVKDSRD